MKKKTTSLLLVFLLFAVVLQAGSVMHFSSVLAEESSVLSAWTCKPPKIDGNIEDEEWSTAAKVDFNITNYNGTIYVMNDGGNLYLAAKITDDDFGTDPNTLDVFMFFFDNDNDGVPEKGDDGLFCFTITGPPYDAFCKVTGPWPNDVADGGTVDGYHDETGDGVYNYFECVHPLDSFDDAHDFSLKIGDVIGFRVRYHDNKTIIGDWPYNGWCHIKIASGDLVLSDNDVYTITGNYYMNGSIIVTENATLVIETARLTFMQTAPFQFNITLKDASEGNPRLVVNNATIDTNTCSFRINLFENSTAQMDGVQLAPNCPVHLLLHDLSSADVSNSTFTEIPLYNNASLILSSSYVGLLRAVDESYARMNDAAFYYLYASNGAEVQVLNSTIIYVLQVKSSKTQCNIQGIKPGFVIYWNFLENCSVIEESEGYASDITLNNVQVNGWSFEFADAVNATITYSELRSLTVSGSSFVCAYRVYVESLSISGFSEVNVTDSKAGNVCVQGFSVLRAVNSTAATPPSIQGQSLVYVSWYLGVHVVDSIGQDVPDANVTVKCADGTVTAKGTTNMFGWVKLTVLASVINATGEFPQWPHTVSAAYGPYQNSTIVNVSGNRQATVVLSEFIVPEFSTMLPAMAMFAAATSAALLGKSKSSRKKR